MLKDLKLTVCRGVLILAALSAAPPAHALTINLTFDPTVAADFGANTISMTNATTYAAQQFENNFNDNIAVNVKVSAVPNTSILGDSSTSLIPSNYNDLITALNNSQSTTNDASAYASLPATDPTGGGHYFVPTGEAKALGLIGASSDSDGTVTFGAGFTFTFDPNNRAVPGAFDFIGVAEHEISEAMGRIPGLGINFDGSPDYMPFDLFRFTASGTRSMTAGDGIYFSLDNGVTNLRNFNSPKGNGSDPQDWDSAVKDSFNAIAAPSGKFDMSAVDLAVMDVLGYHLNPSSKWTWAVNASANWSGSGNWINYGVPTGSGIQVVFDGAINAPRTVTLDVSPTAGTVTFDNATQSFTLSGSGTLALSATQGDAAIQVLSGTHSISADLTLDATTDMIVSSSGNLLTLSGAVDGPGGLIKGGSGKLILSGTVNSYSGGTTVLSGKLIVTDHGALADGSNLTVGTNSGLFPDAIVPSAIPAAAVVGEAVAVPEPATMSLIVAVTAIAALMRRGRARRRDRQFDSQRHVRTLKTPSRRFT
jgi:autotransporter-associated beta strand protein